MRILVTGGAGLIGMAARRMLAAAGHDVIATDRTDFGRADGDLRIVTLEDRQGLASLIETASIEAIVHCGAISGPMMAIGDPALLVRVNINGTAMLLDLARIHRLRRFVFCSSVSVYGDVGSGTISEDTPLRPTSVYGATKVACEQLIRGFHVEYGLDGVSLRIARVYGPYRRANCTLQSMILNAAAGRRTEIPCDPSFIYHYVHVDDVAAAILTAIETEKPSRRELNVCSNEALTMPQIAEIAHRVIPALDVVMPFGTDDVPDRQAAFDISRAERDLGWTPTRTLEIGLRDYMQKC